MERLAETDRAKAAWFDIKDGIWQAYTDACIRVMAGGPQIIVLIQSGERWWAVGPSGAALNEVPPWLATGIGGGIKTIQKRNLDEVCRWAISRGNLVILTQEAV